jgi:hypothetical protein
MPSVSGKQRETWQVYVDPWPFKTEAELCEYLKAEAEAAKDDVHGTKPSISPTTSRMRRA